MDTLKKYAIYIRVSSDQQVQDGDSISTQEALAKEIIKENCGEIFNIYIDPGISASKTDLEDRPALMQLLNDAKEGLFDIVIVFKRDRLARNAGQAFYLRKILRKYKVDVVYSAKGEIVAQKNDPMGNFIEGQFALMAELEAAIISQRTSAVLQNKAKNGEWIGGHPPYGYKRIDDKNVQVPDEIRIVHEVEELYLNGLGEYSITKWLNGKTIKGMGQRPYGAVYRELPNKPGQFVPISKETVRTMLTNTFYHGVITYNRKDDHGVWKDKDEWITGIGDHEPCRDIERYEELIRVRKDKISSKKPPRHYTSEYLLTGHLFCKECGSKWVSLNTTRKGKEYSYYWCSSHKYPLSEKCETGSISKEIIESYVIDVLKNYVNSIDEDFITQKVNELSNETDNSLHNELKKLQSTISDLERRRKKNLLLIEDEEDEEMLNEYKIRQNELRDQIKEAKNLKLNLENRLNQNEDKNNKIKKIIEASRRFSESFNEAPFHLKKKYLEELVNKIYINKDGEIEIEMAMLGLNVEDSNVIIFGEQPLCESPKNITSDESEKSCFSLKVSLIDWIDDTYNETKENFKKWFFKKGQELLKGKRPTKTNVAKVTGLPIHHCSNYLYNGSIPRGESLNLLAAALNMDVDKMIKEWNEKIDKEMYYAILGYKQSKTFVS